MKKTTLFLKGRWRAALLVLLLSVAGLTNALAQTFTVGNLNYSVNDDGVSVTVTGHVDGTSATGSLTIPSSITWTDGNTYSVTTIGSNAFNHCSGFTGDLIIPNSVTIIKGAAFSCCSGFTGDLTIPNSVTTIEWSAFELCPGFTGSLTIPNFVTTIGDFAFEGCSGFTGDLAIPTSVTTIGAGAFQGCTGFTGSLTIPNSVTEIGGFAFSGCSGFSEVHFNTTINSESSPFVNCGGSLYIGDNVERIPAFIFAQAGFTGDLTIPNSVTTIEVSAFSGCSGFTGSLSIGNSVTEIGLAAFEGCCGFTGSLSIGNSVTEIGYSAFYGCSGFTGDLAIPNSVTTIGDYAFYNCSGFTGNLTIPNSVTEIGGDAFGNCSGFSEVHFNATIDSEGSLYAFENCGGSLYIGDNVEQIPAMIFQLAGFSGDLVIPNSVTTIGEYAFEGCSGFTGSLTIGNSVTEIGSFAFNVCSGFTGDMAIPNSVTTIGEDAFHGCSGFTGSLTIGNSVTTIGEHAFEECSGFTGSLTIGNSVTTIGEMAFEGCSGFTGDLAIPNSVTTIGEDAFYGCSGFTGSLTIGNSVTTIGYGAFYGCSGFTGDLAIPNSVTEIGYYAFYGCSGFTGSLTIGNSVTEIGVGAFLNCSGFASIQALAENVPATASDAFAGVNHSIPITVPCGTLTSYQNATGWSEFTNYYEDCGDITQTTNLTSGWNWWSTYIEADDLFDQLTTGLGDNAQQIKSSTSFVNYYSGYWVGGLSSINNESCYLINANNACTFDMTGNQAMPADHPIIISPNWNWIGYPNTGTQSVINAFSNITPTNGDQVKSQNAFSTYFSGMWIGGLNTITPGMGLLYKSNSTETVTLVYPEPNRSEELVENVTNEDYHWTADYHAYPNNMTVMAVIELDDMELQGENYEIAAFANGECRGSARLMYVAPINRCIAFLTVVGDEASELRFSLYDAETGVVETQSIASLQYETNATIGSLEMPYVVRFRSTTGIDERPNNFVFFNGNEWVFSDEDLCHDASLQIIDMMGRVIRCTDVARNVSTTGMTPGVYVLRLICNDTVRTQKIVIDK